MINYKDVSKLNAKKLQSYSLIKSLLKPDWFQTVQSTESKIKENAQVT